MLLNNISIHAPTRGATSNRCSYSFYMQNFNPRSYKRSDEYDMSTYEIKTISIHAPTRGATGFTDCKCYFAEYFNPRSYKRSDGKNAQLSLYLSVIIIA